MMMATNDASRPIPDTNATVTNGLVSDGADETAEVRASAAARTAFDISGSPINECSKSQPNELSSRCYEGSNYSRRFTKYVSWMSEPATQLRKAPEALARPLFTRRGRTLRHSLPPFEQRRRAVVADVIGWAGSIPDALNAGQERNQE
jgi:hypothetical protein